jgi:hypothetical protein
VFGATANFTFRGATRNQRVASEASAMAPFLALAGVLVCQSLVGSKIDSRLVLDFGFPPQKINLAERVANKKVILVGLPGAFTPT